MKRLLFSLIAITISTPQSAIAESAYLVIKSAGSLGNRMSMALTSIPMDSMELCEDAGIQIISSKRFDIDSYLDAKHDSYECIQNK